MMENILLIIFLFIIVLWWVSFLYNSIHFFKSDDSDVDSVFFNKSKTFDEARKGLRILENHLKREFKSAHNKINFYENNAKKTRRKYSYYSDKVEPFFLKVIIPNEGTLFKNCWKLLDRPIKFHYLLLYTFLLIVFSLIAIVIISPFQLYSILIFLLFVAFFLRFSSFIIKLNFILFYLFLDGILILFKQDRGRLYKNIALLSVINSKWLGNLNSGNGYAIGAGGIVAYNSFGDGSGFGGFGGGDFGGGGAGGEW